MNIQTVQIVSGFFGRNGKLCAVDNVFQLVFAHCEVNRQLVTRNNRKVFNADGWQRKLWTPWSDCQLAFFVRKSQLDVRTVGKFADNIVQHMCRSRGCAGFSSFCIDDFGNFGIHVGRFKADAVFHGLNSDIGKYRNGVSFFDNALNMAQSFQ